MRVRTALFITAGIVGAGLGGAVISAALTDPDASIPPVVVPDVSTSGSPPSAAATSDLDASSATGMPSGGSTPAASAPPATVVTVETVDGLEQLVGTPRLGEDVDDWYAAGAEADFGPQAWLVSAPAFADYDGDDATEPLLTELRGLEGREVTLGVRYEYDDDRDRDDADAYAIEGLAYRNAVGGAAPWQVDASVTEATREAVSAAAAAAVGAGAVTVELSRESDEGWVGWDADVRAADGRWYEVYLDLAGTVVDIRADDD